MITCETIKIRGV